jgi:iron complex transport system permease protein
MSSTEAVLVSHTRKGLRYKEVLISVSPLMAAIFALFIGAYDISPGMVLKSIALWISGLGDIPEVSVIVDIRIPRIILAGLVGMALSSSGCVLQGIFRNPLVDPYILGISSGAAFGCALSIAFFPWIPVQISAFLMGLFAILLAYNVARTRVGVSRLSLVLSGVAVSAFFTAMVSAIKFIVDPHKLQDIVYWLMGSFSLANWSSVFIAGIGITVGTVPIFLMRWRLNVLSMGEEEAKALGVNVGLERFLLIAAQSVAVGTATSISGVIGWVGLMVPHLIRMACGPDHRTLLPLSMAGGAAFMILADTVARGMTSFDIPIGIITALSGAPFFVYLLRRSGAEGWGR